MPSCSKCFQPNKTYTAGMCDVCKKAYKSVYNGFYRAEHKEAIAAKDKLWRAANAPRVRTSNTVYRYLRYHTDPEFRERQKQIQREYRKRLKEKENGY